jgi:3-oxoacyl-[acyl-carrier-protein] synthase-3
MSAGILGVGYYVPDTIVTNFDLEKKLNTSDEWIRTRTGIGERRIAADTQATSDLALNAARAALHSARVSADEIDLIIIATCTPDFAMPATAALVQAALPAKKAAAFDLNAACSGFSYALDVATHMVNSGAYRFALVIGADVMSRTLDWTDRSTAILFGDGAGAIIVGQVENGGVLGSVLGANGDGAMLLCTPSSFTRPSSSKDPGFAGGNKMYMNGKEVYKFAVHVMGDAALQALERVGLTSEDVDLFIPHQANIRIIESAAKRLDLPMSKVFVNLDRYGNTSAASIPIALAEAVEQGRVKSGSVIVTVGFGAGLTWGANVIRWTADLP